MTAAAAPVARISLAALAANALPWSTPDAVADLRTDACGHGAAAVARTLFGVGFTRAAADDRDRAAVAATGLAVVDTDPDVVPEALFGLTGVGVPVMRLSSVVLQTKPLLAGEGVSYGYRFRASADTRIALIGGGYAQGIVRSLGGAAEVSIGGRRHPLVGRVAMDVCVADIGDAAVSEGDEVVFFGDPHAGAPAIDAWAQATGMHATELVTAIGLRVQRVHA